MEYMREHRDHFAGFVDGNFDEYLNSRARDGAWVGGGRGWQPGGVVTLRITENLEEHTRTHARTHARGACTHYVPTLANVGRGLG